MSELKECTKAERKGIDAIREAIFNEGTHPGWHRMILEKHREEWPTLWDAIETLL